VVVVWLLAMLAAATVSQLIAQHRLERGGQEIGWRECGRCRPSPLTILGLLICAVALGAILARDLWASIVFYIVYGALLAIAWVRLGSVDVALAEAAIGAGLTGILLIGAAARMKACPRRKRGRRAPCSCCLPAPCSLPCAQASWPCCSSLSMALHRRDGRAGAAGRAAPRLSGVTNPVTAVLLNFRGYDTLLEAVVLVVALVAVWSLTPERFWGGAPGLRQHARPDGVLAHFGRLLPAVGIIVGIHLLWAGSHAPGGAFQAGTVLAAVWLLVAMAGLTDAPAVSDRRCACDRRRPAGLPAGRRRRRHRRHLPRPAARGRLLSDRHHRGFAHRVDRGDARHAGPGVPRRAP
jgi:multisubunit Na+/H+ antiporter MnhB subunit